MGEGVVGVGGVGQFEYEVENEVIDFNVCLFVVKGMYLEAEWVLRTRDLHFLPDFVLALKLNPHPES